MNVTTTAGHRLRVLVVTIVHDPEDARIRYRQIPMLQRAGHDVVYAAPFEAFDREPPPGTRGRTLPRAQGRNRLHAIRAARALLRRIGPSADVILLHDPDLLLSVAGLGRRIAPVIWDVHEDTAAALSMRTWIPAALRRPLAAAVHLAESVAERRYWLLLAESAYRDRFRHSHPVVPNSVLVPPEVSVPDSADRVVYLGKISRARGGAELIDLARAVPELRFQLIGPAEQDLHEPLNRAHADGVLEWFGFLSNAEALSHLPGALAGLALLHDEPNYAHSLPTKLVEYMAHGVAVVSTPNRAAAELVERSAGGIVVPFGDLDAAAEALRSLADAPEQRMATARSGYEYVSRQVNWHVDGLEFARVVETIGRKGPRSGSASLAIRRTRELSSAPIRRRRPAR